MQLSKAQQRRCQELWFNWGDFLIEISELLVKEQGEMMTIKDTEWDNARQTVEYIAKKQALIELKNILSNRYE